MNAERQSFLSDNKTLGNKGNGYRQVFKSSIGSRLQLQVPRDRLGLFKPVIFGVIDQQEEQIKNLYFELYGKGLTTRQIEKIIEMEEGTYSYPITTFNGLITENMQYT